MEALTLVVLREATRMVGVVPNAAYRHFADHDELLAAVCVVSMRELAARMAAGVARVRGPHGDASAARRRLRARLALRTSSLLGTSPGCSPRRFTVPRRARVKRCKSDP